MKNKRLFIGVALFLSFNTAFGTSCTGHFVNPLKDVCWRCLFPLSIGDYEVVKGPLPDSDLTDIKDRKKSNPNPILTCQTSIGERLGLKIGYWEPIALVDVTDTPYCLVNLGGHRIPLGKHTSRGGRQQMPDDGVSHAFYHVHWYKDPLIAWLNLITSAGCQQGGDFDVAYLSELDPTWRDSEMSFVLNPEAAIFGNPVAQSACAADSLSSTLRERPIDSLFWCAGAQGGYYPTTGHVRESISPVQTALLLTERMNFKLHRPPTPLIVDSSHKSPCAEHHSMKVPKSRYRYEMVNQVADGKHCYPSGYSTAVWEMGKIKPHTPDQYGFLVWRKRSCVFTIINK